jgi:NAD(P)-dependent dehydrogenase (short-subunit alcohol dehydrogenase family)
MESPMRGRLTETVAFVTGGGRGLGAGIATALAGAGASVVVAARTMKQVEGTVQSITRSGGQAIAVRCDVTDRDSVAAAYAEGKAAFGAPNLLVNNAGVQGPLGPAGLVEIQAWWDTQAVHVLGALHCISMSLPDMLERKTGRILNIASQAGTFVAPFASAYAVAKASLIRLTEHIDFEQRDAGVRAFAIQPGTIMTAMAEETLRSAQAHAYAKPLVALLEATTAEDSAQGMARLLAFVVELAAGEHDESAGRYLDIEKHISIMDLGDRSS